MAITFRIEQSIQASPEQVFRAITDLDGMRAWMPGLVRVDRLTDGEFGIGTEFRETRKLFGREASEQFEVTRYEPPHCLGLRVDGTKGSSKRGEFLFLHRVESANGGARLIMDGEIRGMGGVLGFLGKLMVGPYKKACAKDLQALGAHLEENRA